jgi:hypothetical protein
VNKVKVLDDHKAVREYFKGLLRDWEMELNARSKPIIAHDNHLSRNHLPHGSLICCNCETLHAF